MRLSPERALHGVDAFLLLVAVHPAESVPLIVVPVQRRLGEVQLVQFQHKVVERIVDGIFQNVPVLLLLLGPLPELSQLAAHEQQLFAGVRIHI